MKNEKWLFLRLWQGLPGQSMWRGHLVDLLRMHPQADRQELKEHAAEQGWLLLDPFLILDSEAIKVARDEMNRAVQRGWSLLTPSDSRYPRKLLLGMDPPLTLMVAGSVEVLSRPALAVVGSREPQSESLRWMENELSAFCRNSQAVIVSGGARGIDQKAHSVAMRNGSPTVAFLPSGLDHIYPRDLESWGPAIFDGGGALVSEYPSSLRMFKQNFHQRNRLIAALGVATLIVEARLRSGSLITATRAAEIGRPLWVVPAHPTSLSHGGNLELLAEGGNMVRQHEYLTLYWQVELESFSCHALQIEY